VSRHKGRPKVKYSPAMTVPKESCRHFEEQNALLPVTAVKLSSVKDPMGSSSHIPRAKLLNSRVVALGRYSHVVVEEPNRSSHCKSRPRR
jgi:hypothetical protein